MNIKEIEDFIADWEIRFEWINKKTYGTLTPQTGIVRLNIRLMIAETLVHEYLHTEYPNFTESTIESMTQAKIQKLTVKQIYKITDNLISEEGG